jgi:hypothetical protein
MLTLETRPMTLAERQMVEWHLRQIKAEPQGCVTYFIMLVGGATLGMLASVVLLAPLMLLERFIPIPMLVRTACVIGTSTFGFLWGARVLVKEKQDQIGPYRRDLTEGRVDVIHCTVTDAAVVEPFEDEGTSFFLQVEDARLLFLQGYHLEDEPDDPEGDDDPDGDPDEVAAARHRVNRELHFVRTPSARLMLQFERLGETFSPSRVIDSIGWLEDGEIITGTLPTLEEDLRRYQDAHATGRR